MVDAVTSIVKLAVALSKVPETVKINRGQCQLLVDRITSLSGHLERMQGEGMQEKLEKSHEIVHLEIDYHSLKKQSIRAEVADVAHIEEELSNVAAKMEKLERSVTTISEESKKQHDNIMATLKNVRIYRQTLGQDQLSTVLATARNEESLERDTTTSVASDSSSPLGGIDAEGFPIRFSRGGGKETGTDRDKLEPQDESATLVPEARLAPGRPPKPNSNLKAVHVVAKKALGPSLHLKPYSQSYGVGLAEGVMAGGWLGDAGSSLEADFGEGGAKRGEYEVSFGEGQMGMSLKNVEARAEVSKVEIGGAAHAAGVRPGDNVSGINGRIPLGYTQVMGSLPLVPRPVRVCFIRGQGVTVSPGTDVKKSHASTWASNAVTAGVNHPAGDKGVLLEMYAKASFSQNPWVRSLGWDALPLPSAARDLQDGGTSRVETSCGADDELSKWSGVRVGRRGKVVELRLPGNNMNGVLPPSMGSLDELRIIELRENRLEGNIPESLRYLQKLTKVDLAHNLLEGSVPGGDARWINGMSHILLNNNKLSGHIPSTLGRLTHLTELDLNFNGLSGTIPSELSTARALEVLCLAHNGLTGPVPQSFGSLTKLKVLNISNNKVTGPLPQGIESLTSLEVLLLAHNSLSGSIPEGALSSASLVLVDMSFNELEGKIPNSVGAYLTNLTVLDISKNSLSGELPSNIGGACKLKKLNLQKNSIEGALPTALAECKALEDLNFSSNLLTGPLVHIQWGNLCNLEHLVLANNKLQGALPDSFGSLASLVSLDISKNQLAGNIPRQLHDLTGLKLLDLSGNKIATGLLPRTSFFSEKRTLKKKLSECDVRF
ncbi:unnamed protein product [Pylaiella littoralis]